MCAKLTPKASPICLGAMTKVGAPKTFRATKSTDADGHIVRYEWDLDGDGAFERDTGDDPEVTHTYQNMDAVTIRLRVTDDDGATDQGVLLLKKLPASCRGTAGLGKLKAQSPCFRKSVNDAGSVTSFNSELPVNVNGMVVTPAPGNKVEVRITRHIVHVLGHDVPVRRLSIRALGGEAAVQVGTELVTFDTGGVNWRLQDDGLHGASLSPQARINGLKVGTMDPVIALPKKAHARVALYPQMPVQFGAPTATTPLVGNVDNFTFSDDADLQVEDVVTQVQPRALASQNTGPMKFTVPSAALGPIGLQGLEVTYDGEDLWAIAASMHVPQPLGAQLKAEVGIRGDAFNYGEVDLEFDNGLGPLGPGLYLTRINFRIEIQPKSTQCVAHIAGTFGQPAFALCGEVGFSAGPMVAGARALGLDGALGFATYEGNKPSVFFAHGKASLATVQFAQAGMEVHTNGYFKVGGGFKWEYGALAEIEGGGELEMLGSKFNLSAHVNACVKEVDLCAGARGLISSKGIAACFDVDLWVTDWHPGFGYRWGASFTPYLDGCELGPYREQIVKPSATAATARAAQAGSDAATGIDLPAGLPGEAFAAKGADAAPVITVVGPDGKRYRSEKGRAVQTKDYMALTNEREKLTQVLIPSPAAGKWRVEVEDGTRLVSLKTAHGLEKPKVSATVGGSGHDRELRYEVEERPGQAVRFLERGASTGGAIGTATGAKGTLRFTPADGNAEQREIVAVVTQDGMPRDEIVVARYAAPAARKAGPVKGLRVTRRGTTLRLKWKRAPRAQQHRVIVQTASGRRVAAVVGGRRHVVRGVRRGDRAKVAVSGITRSGLIGRPARKVVR